VGCSSEETGGPGAPEPAGEEEEEAPGFLFELLLFGFSDNWSYLEEK